MTMILGGVVLPKPSTFRQILDSNETDNVTLGYTLYTDFINTRRGWVIGWKDIKRTDFDTIYNLYLEQYTNGAYHPFQFDAYNIYAPVKLNISDQDIKLNGELVSVQGTIMEQYAFS